MAHRKIFLHPSPLCQKLREKKLNKGNLNRKKKYIYLNIIFTDREYYVI